MELELPEEIAVAGLEALNAVIAADGVVEDREKRLLEAVARALSVEVDVDALAVASPEETAAVITDPVHRERLVQAQLVTALIDGEASAEETETIAAFARALEVDEPRLASLHRLMHGQLRQLQFDLLRRSPMISDVVRYQWEHAGLRGVWKTMAPLAPGRTLAQDPALAARYLALGELPEGAFGRVYFDHMRARGFTFPGQKGGFPEGFVKHDLCHVLGGYDTDPAGECEVGAFIAGFMKHDPFGYLFMLMVHCHLGVEIFQGDATGTFEFDVDRVLAALRRGMRVNRDLYAVDFDWWPYYPRPIADVRAELGVGPQDLRTG